MKYEVIMEKNKHEDIIPFSSSTYTVHPKMSISDRAGHFSPVTVAKGDDLAIRETSRLTENKVELSDDEKSIIERKFKMVRDSIGTNTVFRFIYFVPDKTKHGGAYVPYDGAVKKIDLCQNHLVLTDCTVIDIDQIVGIESDLFQKYEW